MHPNTYLKSRIMKRSVMVGRFKTSISLEDDFWFSFRDIAGILEISPNELITKIKLGSSGGNLSSVIRLFVLDHYIKCSKRRMASEILAGRQVDIVPDFK